MYEYRASIIRVIDGDTVRARLDLGCDVRIDLTLRLYGINAPELNTEAGVAAREHLIALIGDSLVVVRTIKDKREKYGRYLATLVGPLGTDINDRMVADGHAAPYPLDGRS